MLFRSSGEVVISRQTFRFAGFSGMLSFGEKNTSLPRRIPKEVQA